MYMQEFESIESQSVKIRKALKADIPVMQNVFRRAFLVCYGRFVPWKAVQHWVATDMGGQLVANEWETFTVAEIAGQIVGILQVKGDFVHELWVDPDFQRRGIGAELLAHAKTLIAKAGYLVAKVSVFVENENAVKFYLSQGWKPQSTEPDELVPGIVLNVMTLIKRSTIVNAVK